MRLELLIIGLTVFFIFNTYHNGKYTKLLMSYKKYYTMGFIALLGISFYLLIKRNPAKCKNILLHANNMIKYMPIDKSSMDMISPIIDFTQQSEGNDFSSTFMGNLNQQMNPQQMQQQGRRFSAASFINGARNLLGGQQQQQGISLMGSQQQRFAQPQYPGQRNPALLDIWGRREDNILNVPNIFNRPRADGRLPLV
jgi:hypothetical protein